MSDEECERLMPILFPECVNKLSELEKQYLPQITKNSDALAKYRAFLKNIKQLTYIGYLIKENKYVPITIENAISFIKSSSNDLEKFIEYKKKNEQINAFIMLLKQSDKIVYEYFLQKIRTFDEKNAEDADILPLWKELQSNMENYPY